MKERKAALLILIKMALSDGVLTREENEFIDEFKTVSGVQEKNEELIAESKEHKLGDLIDTIDNYADKFFIALRSYSMAHIDDDFDSAEKDLFERLTSAMAIQAEDIELIKSTEEAVSDANGIVPDQRLIELFKESSFT